MSRARVDEIHKCHILRDAELRRRIRRNEEKRALAHTCGLMHRPCDVAAYCAFSAAETRLDSRANRAHGHRIDMCQFAIEADIESCKLCPRKSTCEATWTCFRKAMLARGFAIADILAADSIPSPQSPSASTMASVAAAAARYLASHRNHE